MGITSSGIGSGLDVNSIVTQLMNAERAPLSSLQAKQNNFNAKLSAYGSLKSAVAAVQTSLKGLDSQGLAARTATSSNAAVLGATVGSGAVPGTYSLEVTQLAQQHKLISSGYAGVGAAVGEGTLTIKVGTGDAITLPQASYTLQSLSNAINAAKAGVSATIVNDGTASRLLITAEKSGAENAVTITAGGAPASGQLAEFTFPPDPLATGPTMAQQQVPLDADFKVDGIRITHPSNNAVDVINGLTLNLAQTNVGTPVTLTVANDKTKVNASVKSFVEAYNKLNTTVRSTTAYNAGAQSGAILNGDSGATSIITALRAVLTKPVTGAGDLGNLSAIGVSFQRDGSLAIDDTKLQKAIDNNFDNVSALFSGTDGYITGLTAATTSLLGTNGIISTRTEGFNASIRRLTERKADLEVGYAQTEKRYRAQFTALDSLMNRMQSTSSFLTQQLSALANNNG